MTLTDIAEFWTENGLPPLAEAVGYVGAAVVALYAAVMVFPFVMGWINKARWSSTGRPGGGR
jgi:hypothetical protein